MSEPNREKSKADSEQLTEFEAAAHEKQVGLLTEFFLFLKEEKKWWLTPIILMLLLVGGLAFLSTTGVAPFIYSLF